MTAFEGWLFLRACPPSPSFTRFETRCTPIRSRELGTRRMAGPAACCGFRWAKASWVVRDVADCNEIAWAA